MQVEVKTDNHITGSEELASHVELELEGVLGRYGSRITRVLVYLNDTNAQKGGDRDMRCMMEARIAGHQPVAVTHEAASLDAAIAATTEKLERALDHLFDKQNGKKGRTPFGGDALI
jgi:ribosome-associated translation inhibitor RaiA